MNDDDDKENKGQNNGSQPPFDFRKNRFALVLFLVVVGLLAAILFSNDFNSGRTIPYSTFLEYLNKGDIDAVEILDQAEITGTLGSRSGNLVTFSTKIPYPDSDLIRLLKEKNVRISGGVRALNPMIVILQFLPWTIGIIFIFLMYRQMQGGGGQMDGGTGGAHARLVVL